jgi:predicted PurR-regulated permease PerM
MPDRKNIATLLLAGATAVALYACYLLFRPYITPILFACVIAIVFHPLHRGVRRIFRRQNLSAAVSTVLTLLLSVAPLTFVLIAVSNELSDLYQSLAAKNGGTGDLVASALRGSEKVIAWAGRLLPLPSIDLKDLLLRRLEGMSSSLVKLGAALVTNTVSFVVNTAIALMILFFLYRDGESAVSKIMAALPFPQDRLAGLRTRISSTVVANFYGGVAIGALQGTLTGIIFWALGFNSPVLWGVVTGFFSLVPMIGTAIIWVPAAIVLLLTGHLAKGFILLALGGAVIGTVDNFIRPIILHKSVHLHMLLTFFALLGGLQVFGVLGLFVGPVILSVTAALLTMLKEDLAAGNQFGVPRQALSKSSQGMGRTES